MEKLSVSDVFNKTLLECTFYEDGEAKTFVVPIVEYFDLVERNTTFGFSKESVYYWFRDMECSFYLALTEYNKVPENVEFDILVAPTNLDHKQLCILYNYIGACDGDREFEAVLQECIEYHKEEFDIDILGLK